MSGLQFPNTIAGVLVMSGYLAGAKQFNLADAQLKTPVMHLHGRADPMVKHEWAERTQKHIIGLGHEDYTLKSYDELQHTVSEEEFADAISFLKDVLPSEQ